MIIEELKRLAEQEQLLSDEGYGPQKVHCLITIDREGRFHGLIPTMEPPASGKGNPQPKQFALPSPEGRRTSGDRANFLYDKRDYVFDGSPNRKRLFREAVDAGIGATNDEGLAAVRRFLDRFDRGETKIDFSVLPKGAVFAFRDIDDPEALISDRPAVREYWRAKRAAGSGERVRCVVCCNEGPVARIHPEIKNVPGGNPAGVAIVSFNNASEWSYGHDKDERYLNAPFCRTCADAYTRALNRLLAPEPGFLKPGGRFPVQNYRMSSDTIAVFWSPQSSFAGRFGKILRGNPEAVRELLASPVSGHEAVADGSRFFAIILSGAQGRAIVRSALRSTVSDVAANLRQHFQDLALVPVFPNDPGTYPLYELLASTRPTGKQATVAPAITQELFEAALLGRRYPLALLDAALRRLRAGEDFSRLRLSIIKAVLNRKRRLLPDRTYKEVNMALDVQNTDPGYRLGRLFAVLERLQGDAINNPNATIVDRYYGAASTTPVVVFPRLLGLAQHHAAKSNRGGWFQKLIEEIASGIDPNNSFPTLSMEQQGLFALGYYHQRADLWKKRETPEASA